jgi:tRNA dimethylallyltransferase
MAVFDVSGKGLSDWQRTTVPFLPPGAWSGVAIVPPRETLYERCDSRLEQMIAEGALNEVAALMARGLDPGQPLMKALGVAPLAAQLRGEMSPIDALAQARTDTRRYAKRQISWLRHQAQAWPRIDAAGADAQWDALSRRVFHAPSPALTSSRRDGMT